MKEQKEKILNLYAGVGGNRKLWGNDAHVTAIEINPKIAEIYQTLNKDDDVIIADAHQFLLEHYSKFDFIWSSPPCQSHSSIRKNLAVRFRSTKALYPDFRLYEEIVFLQHHYKGKWTVENVKPYYPFLIEPTVRFDRHCFWSNFPIKQYKSKNRPLVRSFSKIKDWEDYHTISLQPFEVSDKRQILRNCVHPTIGLHIYECWLGSRKNVNFY